MSVGNTAAQCCTNQLLLPDSPKFAQIVMSYAFDVVLLQDSKARGHHETPYMAQPCAHEDVPSLAANEY